MATKRQIDIDMKLHEFGQRARANWAKNHPAHGKNLEVVKDAVREQWEKEQQKNYEMPTHEPSKTPEREPDGPEMEM
jgi:hypothetical protein